MPDSTGWSRAAEEAIKQQPVYAREVLDREPQPRNADGSLIPTPDAADPDTTLEGEPFVTAEELTESGEVVETADVFHLVAAYDHVVENAVPPTFDTYEAAQMAGVVLLTVNSNVKACSIIKSVTRKQ